MGFQVVFSVAGGFADVGAADLTTFGAAFVDFALVVASLIISISTGSEMSFLGLPLFFTASEDMLAVELGWGELLLSEDSKEAMLRIRRGASKVARRQINLTRPRYFDVSSSLDKQNQQEAVSSSINGCISRDESKFCLQKTSNFP